MTSGRNNILQKVRDRKVEKENSKYDIDKTVAIILSKDVDAFNEGGYLAACKIVLFGKNMPIKNNYAYQDILMKLHSYIKHLKNKQKQ